MKELLKELQEFEEQLTANKAIKTEKFVLVAEPAEPAQLSIQKSLNRIEPSVLNFYEFVNRTIRRAD